MTVHQDASLYGGALDAAATVTLDLTPGRRAWVQVLRGNVSINGEALGQGDGAATEREGKIVIVGGSVPSEVLVFDLA